MSMQCKATTKSGAEIVYCSRNAGHPGEHRAFADDYRTIVTWAPRMEPGVTSSAMTIEELLADARDLQALAEHEGFHTFAAAIDEMCQLVEGVPFLFKRGPRQSLPPSTGLPS